MNAAIQEKNNEKGVISAERMFKKRGKVAHVEQL